MTQGQLLVDVLGSRTLVLDIPCQVDELHNTSCVNVTDIKAAIEKKEGIPTCEQRLSCGNKEIINHLELEISKPVVIRLSLRLLGGKGGFGALLRGAGNKGAKKITNFDDCRDLNGRRIRHVKQEQKLSEWYEKQKQIQIENEGEVQQEKPKKKQFDSTTFRRELEEITETVESSVEEGLRNAELKRKSEPKQEVEKKKKLKTFKWDDFDVEDSDEEQPHSNNNKHDEQTTTESNNTNQTTQQLEATKTEAPKLEKIDLNNFESQQDLEALGIDKLKEQLQLYGLLCGGTLAQRAARLFSIKGKKPEEIDPKILAKKK